VPLVLYTVDCVTHASLDEARKQDYSFLTDLTLLEVACDIVQLHEDQPHHDQSVHLHLNMHHAACQEVPGRGEPFSKRYLGGW